MEQGSDGRMSRGTVIGLAALVAVVSAVVSALVTAQVIDDEPSTDEVAGELRSELREFVNERIDDLEPLPTPSASAVATAPGSIDVDGLSGETFPVEQATLTVHSDGCGVIRTEFDETPHNLTWSVKDGDGFEVLGRNAEGESRYRYYQPGIYTVVLEAWNGDSYAPVSNEVTIAC